MKKPAKKIKKGIRSHVKPKGKEAQRAGVKTLMKSIFDPSNSSTPLREEFDTLYHGYYKYDGKGNIINPIPLPGYLKDERLELRTSVAFKSLTQIAAILRRETVASYISRLIFFDAIQLIAKEYPTLFGRGSGKLTDHSLSDIVLEIGKHVDPVIFRGSRIFQDVLKSKKVQSAAHKKKLRFMNR
ncbi:MAG: hypothetical protein IM631_12485 [Cytophagales bacterium]|nr:hypothetical protein [Cytophagales bacterium]MCA6382332.1 hypothetical protein [Cytophagales bacterium]